MRYRAIMLPLTLLPVLAAADTFKVLQFRESRHESAPAIDVRFSAPIAADQDVDALVSLHHDSGLPDGSWLVNPNRTKLTWPFVEPDRTYHLQVSPSLRSGAGVRLSPAKTSWSLRTRRLVPVASFASRGTVLPADSEFALPVSVVNVDAVDIDFFRVAPESLGAALDAYILAGKVSHGALARLPQLAEHVHTGRFDINPRENQRTVMNVRMRGVRALRQKGVYIAVMKPAGSFDYHSSVMWFTVSDIGMHARRYRDHVDLYLNSLEDGDPLADVSIELFARSGERIAGANTAGNGHARLMLAANAQVLVASRGKETTLLRIDRSPLDLVDFKNAVSVHAPVQAFPFGPRDLYQPGETVQLQLLLRDYDGQRLPDVPVAFEIYRPDGQRQIDTALAPGDAGYYQLDYQLPASAPTGRWRVVYRLGTEALPQKYHFNVEEFRPQRLRLEVMPALADPATLNHQATLRIPVAGSYLFGATAQGNRVDGQVSVEPERHPYTHLERFHFGLESDKPVPRRQRVADITLDANGRGELSLPNRWRELRSPLRAELAISLYESGGRPVTEHRRVTLMHDAPHVGIAPGFEKQPDANSTVDFEIVATNAAGEPQRETNFEASLVREDRSYYWSWTSHRGWHWDFEAAPYTAWSGAFTTGATGIASLSVPLEFGHYRLVVRDGRGATSDFAFETAGRWWSNVRQDRNQPETVFLGLDKAAYTSGNRAAQLSYLAPHSGRAVLTVESGSRVLYREEINLDARQGELTLPLNPAWNRHDLYVALMVLSPSDTKDQAAPRRAFGLTHLPVARTHQEIQVLATAPASAKPGETITATLRVDPDILQSTTWVSTALVDVGITNLTKHRTPRPQDWFFAPRRYEVDLYDMYGAIIENAGLRSVRQRFGGGYGNENEERLPGTTRDPAKQALAAWLHEPVAFDANGEATVQFTLPDFDGRLRWSFVAFSDNQFGSTRAYTQVASPLVAQISASRFLAGGDSSVVAIDVTNVSGARSDLEAQITLGGALGKAETTHQITLDDGDRTTLTVPVTTHANGESEGKVTVRIRDAVADINVTRSLTVPVRQPWPAVTRVTHTRIDAGETWTPALDIASLEPETLRASLALARQPSINVNGHLSSLLAYPHGCLEQITSRAIPWLHVSEALIGAFEAGADIERQFGKPFSEALRHEQLGVAVQELQAKQQPGGGFGLWSAGGRENPWLTVYATDFLLSAEQRGLALPQGMRERALRRLTQFTKRGRLGETWVANQSGYRFAVQAYAGFVLARAGLLPMSDARRLLAGASPTWQQSGLPWVHLGLALHLLGDTGRSARAFARASEATRDAGIYLGDYGSPLRDVTWRLLYGSQYNVGPATNWATLTHALRDRQSLSTQEKAQLIALAAAWHGKGKGVDVTLSVGGAPRKLERPGAFASVLSAQEFSALDSITAQDPTFAELSVTGYPAKAPEPARHGILIRKMFLTPDGAEADLANLKSGDLVVVRLSATADTDVPDAMLIDLLPAGLELENQNLAAVSIRLDSVLAHGPNPGLEHEEHREDRYVAALRLPRDREVHVHYLARAVTPGSYVVPPPFAEDMYRPYRFGLGTTRQLTVHP